MFFFDLGLSTYFFLFNLFLVGHGFTEKTLGFLASAFGVGCLAGAIPAGRLVRQLGLRPVLLLSLLVATVSAIARATLLASAFQVIFAFVAGLSIAAWGVCIAPVVAQLADEHQRPKVFSLVFSLGIGVGALGALASSRLPGWFANQHVHRFQPDQLVLILSSCVVAVGIWPAARLKFIRHTEVVPQARKVLSPFLWLFLPAIAAWSLVTGSFSPFANVYFSRHIHMSLPQIGNAFACSQLIQVAAVLVAPWIFKRCGLVGSIVFTQLSASVLLLILAMVGHPFAASAGYVAFSAFQWMNEPGIYSLLMNMVPDQERGSAAALNSFVMSSSQAIAALIAGQAFARFGYPASLCAIAVVALFAALLFLRMRAASTPVTRPLASLDADSTQPGNHLA